MRISPRILGVALSLAWPLGVGCSGGAEPSGAGGATDPSTGDFSGNDVGGSVTVGSGAFPRPGWTNVYGDAADQHASALAVRDDGECALAGTVRGTVDFGNLPLAGSTTDTDVVVARISGKGQSLWSRRFGDSCDQHGGAVATTTVGNMLLAGDFCGKMDFGTTAVATKGAEVDLFVALFNGVGQDLYSRSFGGKGAQIARAAAVDSQGNAVVVGLYDQAFDDGSGELASAGLDDSFVIKLDPEGNLLWSLRFGGPESDVARGVAVDATGNIVVGGSFGGSVDFGGGPLTASTGHSSGFVLEINPDGKHLWSKSLGGDGDTVVNGVDIGPTGNVAAAGYFLGTADFGSGTATSTDAEDAFLATMNSEGNPLWGRTVGGHLSQRATGVAFGKNGDVAISGTSDESIYLAAVDPAFTLPSYYNLIGPGMVYALRYNAAGTPLSSRAFGSAKAMESVGIGLDSDSLITLAGSGQDTLSFPGDIAKNKGGWDIFVSRDL